ncbi:hypothetical protein [Thiobacillus sp.]
MVAGRYRPRPKPFGPFPQKRPLTEIHLASSNSNGNGFYFIRSSLILVDSHVGDVLAISAAFGISRQANITDLDRQNQFGAFADGRNTAGIWLGDLPAGMVITSASGHDYTIDPTAIAASVPKPESYAMLLAGLGLPGFVTRLKEAESRLI